MNSILIFAICAFALVSGQVYNDSPPPLAAEHDGQPGCRIRYEFTRLWRNNYESKVYWRCAKWQVPATEVHCPPGTRFQDSWQTCVPFNQWQWTPYSEPPTRPGCEPVDECDELVIEPEEECKTTPEPCECPTTTPDTTTQTTPDITTPTTPDTTTETSTPVISTTPNTPDTTTPTTTRETSTPAILTTTPDPCPCQPETTTTTTESPCPCLTTTTEIATETSTTTTTTTPVPTTTTSTPEPTTTTTTTTTEEPETPDPCPCQPEITTTTTTENPCPCETPEDLTTSTEWTTIGTVPLESSSLETTTEAAHELIECVGATDQQHAPGSSDCSPPDEDDCTIFTIGSRVPTRNPYIFLECNRSAGNMVWIERRCGGVTCFTTAFNNCIAPRIWTNSCRA